MKKIITSSLFVILTPILYLAANSPQFQLQIQPLGCSVDTLNNGVATTTQLSPEDCLPGNEPATLAPVDRAPFRPADFIAPNTIQEILFSPIPVGHESVPSKTVPTPRDDVGKTEQQPVADKVVPVIIVTVAVAAATTAAVQFGVGEQIVRGVRAIFHGKGK